MESFAADVYDRIESKGRAASYPPYELDGWFEWVFPGGLKVDVDATVAHVFWYYKRRGEKMGKDLVVNLAPLFTDTDIDTMRMPLYSDEENGARIKVRDLAWYLEGWLTEPRGPWFYPNCPTVWDSIGGCTEGPRIVSPVANKLYQGQEVFAQDVSVFAGAVSAMIAGGPAGLLAAAAAFVTTFAKQSAERDAYRAKAIKLHEVFDAAVACKMKGDAFWFDPNTDKCSTQYQYEVGSDIVTAIAPQVGIMAPKKAASSDSSSSSLSSLLPLLLLGGAAFLLMTSPKGGK